MKINQNKLARVGMMIAAAGMMATLGGCAAPGVNAIPEISKFDRTGKGEIFIAMGVEGKHDATSVCTQVRNLGINDARCDDPSKYYVRHGAPSFNGMANSYIAVMIPNNVVVESNDIIKIKMKPSVPAYFEKFISKGYNFRDKSADCYMDWTIVPFTGGHGGIVCPKYDWDYRNYVPNP